MYFQRRGVPEGNHIIFYQNTVKHERLKFTIFQQVLQIEQATSQHGLLQHLRDYRGVCYRFFQFTPTAKRAVDEITAKRKETVFKKLFKAL